jgi:hypothetical protein
VNEPNEEIKAKIAQLKEEAIENGDWAKWERSQRNDRPFWYESVEEIVPLVMHSPNAPQPLRNAFRTYHRSLESARGELFELSIGIEAARNVLARQNRKRRIRSILVGFLLAAAVLWALISLAHAHDLDCQGKPVPESTKLNCCGKADHYILEPGQARENPEDGSWTVHVNGYTITVPEEKAFPSEDGCWHIFYNPNNTKGDGTPYPYCFFWVPQS